jgi:hypothetical protein
VTDNLVDEYRRIKILDDSEHEFNIWISDTVDAFYDNARDLLLSIRDYNKYFGFTEEEVEDLSDVPASDFIEENYNNDDFITRLEKFWDYWRARKKW